MLLRLLPLCTSNFLWIIESFCTAVAQLYFAETATTVMGCHQHHEVAIPCIDSLLGYSRQTEFAMHCCSAASGTLRWAVSRSAVPGATKSHRNGEAKNKERSIDVKKIVKVESGTGQFPGSNGTKGEFSASSDSFLFLMTEILNGVSNAMPSLSLSAHIKKVSPKHIYASAMLLLTCLEY